MDAQINYLTNEDKIIINLRYNNPSFNPVTIYSSIDESEEEKMKNIGIRSIYKISKKVRYTYFVSYAELMIEL